MAVGDLPRNEAPGSDLVPNEVYTNCPALIKDLTKLFNGMIRRAQVPCRDRRFFIVPSDKPGRGAVKSANKCPLIKLSEFILVQRFLPLVSEVLLPDQYAQRNRGSTETLLSDLDPFASEEGNRGLAYIRGRPRRRRSFGWRKLF